MLPVAAPADSIKWIADGVVDMAASGWGDYSIMGKAKAAILLANSGRNDVARNVVESLRQFARKSGDRGTYWDIDGIDKVTLASTALKALNKANPDDPMIDDVRHWLLLAKENAMLGRRNKGVRRHQRSAHHRKNWTAAVRKAPQIKVGNVKIDTDAATPYFGYIRRSIDMKRNDGSISIRRDKDVRHGERYIANTMRPPTVLRATQTPTYVSKSSSTFTTVPTRCAPMPQRNLPLATAYKCGSQSVRSATSTSWRSPTTVAHASNRQTS